MAKTTTLTFLLAGILAFSAHAMAQQQTKPSEHDHHDHSGHDMSQHNNTATTDPSHDHDAMDHSGHNMEPDHTIDHSDHSGHGDHATSMQSAEHGDAHHHHHMDHDHIMDHEGTMIMGQNLDKLPSSCKSISEEVEITVRAGRKYSAKFPGTAFAFDQQQWHVKPCAKVTWHFINEDNIRHQFMMHGLPKYLYKYGMFHLEVTGPKTVSGTIIVPGSDETFLVHCDISHHMEKGMKAQLVVGKGGENIPSIPGLTPYNINDTYEAENLPKISDKAEQSAMVRQITAFTNKNFQDYGMMLIGLLIGLLCIPLFKKIPFRKKSG
ncbi:cupredoxin domain-containing protein [Nitrosomonas sp.]|uniref:cupredoxin domain-containing protein n=1 Tax=Nitrosomonas sp. TaxID=42353 RepID=UPI00271ED2E2|nr:cupredoxin domain-containing protein [Nitrosomonas sp.]MDO8893907.1 cupredoxin domain-containing protein [Nitrosomonas sp.]